MPVKRPISVLSFCVGLCRAYVEFLYPGVRDRDLTFNYIDTVYFTWVSSVESPYMNLWCAPTPTAPQSSDYLYHERVPSNGTNAISFPYGGYNKAGLCHMQVESFSGDAFNNTPTFNLTSNDSAQPRTWGLNELGLAGGSPEPTSVQQIQQLGSVPFSVLAAAMLLPASSTTSTSSSSSSASTVITTLSSSSISLMSTTTMQSSPSSQSPITSQSSIINSSSSSSSNASLSPGAKAGISIGSIIALLLLALLLTLAWYLKSRLRQRQQQQQEDEPRWEGQEKKLRVMELEGGQIGGHELDGEGLPNELQGRPRAEVHGDTGAFERS